MIPVLNILQGFSSSSWKVDEHTSENDLDVLSSAAKARSETCLAFEAFLDSEYTIENLHFWRECQSYASIALDEKRREERKARAVFIYRQFLMRNAPEWVCVSNDIAAQILADLSLTVTGNDASAQIVSNPRGSSNHVPSGNIFMDASRDILSELQSNMLPRFIDFVFPANTLKKNHLKEVYLSSEGWSIDSVRGHLLDLALSSDSN